MRTTTGIVLITAIGIFLLCGCQKLSDLELSDVFVSQVEIDKTLVNFALAKNGAEIFVSEDNPSHPASTLNNGITSSEKWHQEEGWENYFEGRLSYGKYGGYGYGGKQRRALQELARAEQRAIYEGRDPADVRINPEDFVEEDYRWRGLRSLNRYYAMGWVVVELPEPKRINRVIVYTVDSERFPVAKYGVRDVTVQYWTMRAKGWQSIDRYGKEVGQKDNSIRNNMKQKIVFRFKPVKTNQVRVIIRWTNDTEKHRIYRDEYVKGTVRLTEIVIYGFEKKTSEESQEDTEIKKLLEEQEDTEEDTEDDLKLKGLLDE